MEKLSLCWDKTAAWDRGVKKMMNKHYLSSHSRNAHVALHFTSANISPRWINSARVSPFSVFVLDNYSIGTQVISLSAMCTYLKIFAIWYYHFVI